MPRRYVIKFASSWIKGKQERRRVKALLKKGQEPEPKYSSGKYWND